MFETDIILALQISIAEYILYLLHCFSQGNYQCKGYVTKGLVGCILCVYGSIKRKMLGLSSRETTRYDPELRIPWEYISRFCWCAQPPINSPSDDCKDMLTTSWQLLTGKYHSYRRVKNEIKSISARGTPGQQGIISIIVGVGWSSSSMIILAFGSLRLQTGEQYTNTDTLRRVPLFSKVADIHFSPTSRANCDKS